MNLVLLMPDEIAPDGTVRLTGRRAKHVLEVHRIAVGDALRAGVLDGKVGTARVLAVSPEEVVLAPTLDSDPPARTGIDLLLALPRPKILKKVLQAVASMGVERLVLVNSFRVEKSYFGSPVLAPEELKENLVLGLEQGRDTRLPEVRVATRFRPFVEDELAGLWSGHQKLLPHPVAPRGFADLEARAGEKVVLAIGPEGGWIPYEVERLEEKGFAPIAVGERILRVDVAVPYIVGQVALWRALTAKGLRAR